MKELQLREAVVCFEEWERLSRVPSFGRLLMAAPLAHGDLPDRHADGLRATDLGQVVPGRYVPG